MKAEIRACNVVILCRGLGRGSNAQGLDGVGWGSASRDIDRKTSYSVALSGGQSEYREAEGDDPRHCVDDGIGVGVLLIK